LLRFRIPVARRRGLRLQSDCEKGIRFGRLEDAKVLGLILDQQPMSVSSTAEGVGVDSDGNVFGAEVGPKDLKKYLKK
jgi:hypothetical protein